MNDAISQMALAHDAKFLNRVQYLLCRVALQVAAEDPGTANHAARREYAQAVLGDPARAATPAAVALVGAINLLARATTISFDGVVTTAATDPEIESQINSLWNAFSGV